MTTTTRATAGVYLADILLHEQVHQWQYQLGSPSKTKHDVEFTAKCNEIGDQLGLGHVVSRRRKGDPVAAHRRQLADNVRPDGYYGDLWGEISEPEQKEDWLSQILGAVGSRRSARPTGVPPAHRRHHRWHD